jgi:class 3 adenylate cyclase/tetratricopeptide (TPR) repeat protein
VECVACARELPEGSAFCLACGAPQTPPSCPACGQVLPSGSQFCNRCGSAVAAAAPATALMPAGPPAERRVTSVLFADLVAYTTLSESRDSEDVRSLLSEYFEVCSTIVRRYGGTTEKFIGDAVMAVWGVPTSHEDDAERAVRAGLELVTGVTALGERLGVPQLALRVGIVTGEVAANLSARDQGMVAGDPVNTAARVQSAAGPGEVWVDATTRTLTAAAVTYFDAGEHLLKGKAEPVHLFRAGAVVAARGGSQRVDGLEATLVGRDRQMRLLKELFHGTEESGRPAVVVLDGEAGVGKSRLGWEFQKYIDGLETSVAWHRGRCLSYGDGVAFWALSEAVRARVGLVEDDAAAVVLAGLDRTLAEIVPDEAERAWLRPRVASLLGEETREFAREDLFTAWASFLEHVGGGDPVVLLIDDAHHADQGLLDFVDHVSANARFGLFVLVLARPELLERHSSLGGRRASVLRLEPLPDQALRQLVADLVGGLDDAAADSLVRRAEGIPLFAVETVRALIDRGVVGPVEGRYVVMPGRRIDLEEIGAPASLHALVAARLDAPSPQERRVLTDASVLGESFTREGIGILAHDVPDLDAVLDALQRRELVITDNDRFSAERGQFRFVQSVVRQVAYSTMARSDRKARHLLVADHLQSDHERADELAQVIARHLLDAAEVSGPTDQDVVALRERASALLVTAGNRACGLGAFADGLRSYRAALDITGDGVSRAAVLSRAAHAALLLYRFEETRVDAEEAIRLFDEAGDILSAATAAYPLARALGEMGRHDEAVAVAKVRLAAVADVPGSEVVIGRLSRVAGGYLQFLGKPSEAAPYVDTALRMSDLAEDHETFAGAMNLLALHQTLRGSHEVAHLIFAGMADVARKHEQWGSLTLALGNESTLLASRDLGSAIDLTRQADANQAEHGLPGHVSSAANLCNWYWLSGRWDELQEHLEAAATQHSDTSLLGKTASGVDLLLVWAGVRSHRLVERYPGEDAPLVPGVMVVEKLRLLCRALVEGNRATLAERASELVMGEVQVNGVSDDLHAYWPLAVRATLEADDLPGVTELLRHLASYSDRALPAALRAHRWVVQGLIEMRAQSPDDDEVVSALEAGIALLAQVGAVVWEAHAREDLGVWHLARARRAQAEPHLAAAQRTYENLGATTWLTRLDTPSMTQSS